MTAPEPGAAQLLERGSALARDGEWAAAIEAFESATGRPDAPAVAWQMLGAACMRAGQPGRALVPLRRAFEMQPGNRALLRALADAEFLAGTPDRALPLWQRLASFDDDETVVLRHGECLSRLGRHADATAVFRTAIDRDPGNPVFWHALAQAEEDRGDAEAAGTAYRRARSLAPQWALPLAGLLALQRGKADTELLAAGASLLATTRDDAELAQLGYALGRARDARGEHEDAMAAWSAANAARRRQAGGFDGRALATHVQELIAAFDAPFFASRAADTHPTSQGNDDARPVFIVGMPRSGTTLLEQMLASHPGIGGCGELPDVPALVARFGGDWPRRLDAIDAPWLRQAASGWLASAQVRAERPDAARLVDKAPLNFFNLGLVALLFPQARVLWARRDPRDIIVSIHGENFAPASTFATRPVDIAAMVNAQTRLMRHWQAVLPLPILEVVYEDLVQAPEATLRRVLGFLGLPWDPACLDFHARTAGVQTPSRWQVRQPLHRGATGRWQPYAETLGPAFDVLDGDTFPGSRP